jgi:dUTPase
MNFGAIDPGYRGEIRVVKKLTALHSDLAESARGSGDFGSSER